MDKEEKIMTGEESLKIITDMINRTKTNVRQNSFHLLFWGWLIFGCSLIEFLLLKFTHIPSPWNIWILVVPGILVSIIHGMVTGKKERVHTYADTVYLGTWLGYIIVLLIMLTFLNKNNIDVPPYILMATGLPTFISGFILKFKPLIFGGISFWIFSILAFYIGPPAGHIMVPLAMLTGYLIPGYLLKRTDAHGAV